MRTFIHTHYGFMEFLCVIDFIMKSTSQPQVTASDYTVENVSCDDNDISRYASKTEDTLFMFLCLMRNFIHTQDGVMVFLCVIDFIMKSCSWPQVTHLVQQLNDKFRLKCAFYDKSMKLGTIILDILRVILKTEGILNLCRGGHFPIWPPVSKIGQYVNHKNNFQSLIVDIALVSNTWYES